NTGTASLKSSGRKEEGGSLRRGRERKKAGANGDHETVEARERREKRETKERRKRREAKAAAHMVGGEYGVTNGQPSAEQSLADSTGSAGIQGGSGGRREPKSSRKKGSDGADVRKNLNTHSANEGDAAARHGTAGNSGGNDSGGGHSGESARKGRR
ncbi:unnamed protein product, partial [Ascophyllum nodosum]